MSPIDLPFETLHLIAVEVADHNPADLASLALANKQCFAVCRPLINSLSYHEIQIFIHEWCHETITPTTSAIAELIQLLNDANAMSHVRRLRIDSRYAYYRRSEEHHSTDWRPPKITELKRKNSFQSNDAMDDIFDYIFASHHDYPRIGGPMHAGPGRPNTLIPGVGSLECTPVTDVEQRRAWNMISTLVERIPNLEDIFYLPLDPLPSTFLGMLHSQKPHCRLHLHALMVIDRDIDGLSVSRLYDRRLLTSPLLYSVVLNDGCMEERRFPFVPDEQLETNEFPVGAEIIQALRQAPNLSHVYVRPTLDSKISLTSIRMTPMGYSKARPLRELHFQEWSNLEWRLLSGWQTQFDFSQLEVLKLHKELEDDEDDYFRHLLFFRDVICRDRQFRSLKVLELHFGSNTIHLHEEGRFYSVIQECIENLFPLRELILEQWGKMLPLQSIVQTHGSTLRRLSLRYRQRSNDLCCLSESDVHLIANECPLLEDLSCKVRRSQGNRSEVAIYRALGKIRRLRYLSLDLVASYCSMMHRVDSSCHVAYEYMPFEERSLCWRHWGPTDGCAECSTIPPSVHDSVFDEFDSQKSPWGYNNFATCNGYIKQFMIDSAIDKGLACAIFREIMASKPSNSLRLEVMNIQIDELPGNCIFPMAWRVESRLQFHAPDEIIAWEVNFNRGVFYNLESRQKPLNPDRERIFKRIWPDDDSDAGKHTGSAATNDTSDSDFSPTPSNDRREHGDRNWWTKWKSFSLCSE